MATIKRSLSTKPDGDGNFEIMLRLCVSRQLVVRLKSGIHISKSRFGNDGSFIKPRANQKELAKVQEAENALVSLEQFLFSLCATTDQSLLDKDYIIKQIDRWRNPEKYAPKEAKAMKLSFDDIIDEIGRAHV